MGYGKGILLAWMLMAVVVGSAWGATLTVPAMYPTIQSAIEAAEPGDTVLVAAGTYVENIDFLGKSLHVKSVSGPEGTVIDGGQSGSVVRFVGGEGRDAILEGFTLTNGTGDPHTPGSTFGGGVFCLTSSPTIRGNVIRGNSAYFGGGVACYLDAHPLIVDNDIVQNTGSAAGSRGGGIQCDLGSSPEIRGNRIHENEAYFGGGIFCDEGSAPLILENVISENTANAWGVGGGIVCFASASPYILRNDVTGNNPGGIHCSANAGRTTIEDNRISWNLYGGGVECTESDPLILENLITENSHGITCFYGSPRIISNRITRNDAEWGIGAGILCSDYSSPFIAGNLIYDNMSSAGGEFGSGTGIYMQYFSSPTIVNNTVTGNHTPDGNGGIFCLGWSVKPLIVNTIVWGNDGETDFRAVRDADPTLIHCDVGGGWEGNGWGNFDADPRLVDAQGGDLHLRFGSPCVDAGDETVAELGEWDFERDPRILNGDADPEARVDIGADELLPEAAARFGTVNAAGSSLASVLLVNGSAGDLRGREVTVPPGGSLLVEMLAPPAGPDPARFVLYAWDGKPDSTTITPQPFHLGVMGHATPLRGPTGDQPIVIWNNLGHEWRLGVPDHPSHPAPSVVVDAPGGVAYQTIATLQGFIEDEGSTADGSASITNAVIVSVISR